MTNEIFTFVSKIVLITILPFLLALFFHSVNLHVVESFFFYYPLLYFVLAPFIIPNKNPKFIVDFLVISLISLSTVYLSLYITDDTSSNEPFRLRLTEDSPSYVVDSFKYILLLIIANVLLILASSFLISKIKDKKKK